MPAFEVVADFAPAGDQGPAIAALCRGLDNGYRHQTLKGVTGSGKTFSMAKIIEAAQAPTLVISHNKTLAAQLYREFKDFLPHNAVEYFVSYYDYYQPEAYVASRDLYIEKDASINDEIERLRLGATTALMERRDVVVVATVSCIYGLGSPDDYRDMRVELEVGTEVEPRRLMRRLVALQYTRNDAVLMRAGFRSRGEVIEVLPPHAKEGLRIEFFGDEIERLRRIDPLTGNTLAELEFSAVYPAKHFVTPEERLERAVESIREELAVRHEQLLQQGKLVEAQRLLTRCEYDLEMLAEIGYCGGIENYSRHLSGREPGERPGVLIDFLPEGFLTIVDESHVTLPQVRGMFEGDRSRKQALVEHGFRLPSALDNRPLTYDEFESVIGRVLFVSATPGRLELSLSDRVAEQVIRPTGLLDPQIHVRPSEGQIDDLYGEIRARVEAGERCLVTTLTKRMSEDLSSYLAEIGLRVRYLHSEVETVERVELLRDLRAGEYDVLVGVNLLREGLDLPEVSLIAILDADKIGFLRSATSLIQIIGRAARHVNGTVLMYADAESEAMREAIAETERRRAIQTEHNRRHGITPTSIKKEIQQLLVRKSEEKRATEARDLEIRRGEYDVQVPEQRADLIRTLEREMLKLAEELEFERAAVLRDEIERIKDPAGESASAAGDGNGRRAGTRPAGTGHAGSGRAGRGRRARR
jgi:excinuclease ABC subunit B